MIRVKELKKVIKEFKAKKELVQNINTFLNSVNRRPLTNEKLIDNDGINGTFKENLENKVVENSIQIYLILLIHNYTNYLRNYS
jgi:hypothetical protein